MNRPTEHICPITLEVMRDPVVAADGNSYERDAIQQCFQTSRRSPLTRENLSNTTLIPNNALRKLISDWPHDRTISTDTGNRTVVEQPQSQIDSARMEFERAEAVRAQNIRAETVRAEAARVEAARVEAARVRDLGPRAPDGGKLYFHGGGYQGSGMSQAEINTPIFRERLNQTNAWIRQGFKWDKDGNLISAPAGYTYTL